MIRPVQASELADALRLAFQDFDNLEQDARVISAQSQQRSNPKLFDGMLVATNANGRIEGLIWIVEMPGRTCVTGLPSVKNVDDLELMMRLLKAANQWLDTSGCSLNQFVLSPEQNRLWGRILHHAHHPIEICLDHMAVSTDVDFVEHAGNPRSALGAELIEIDSPQSKGFSDLLNATFLNSDDCPAITGHQNYKDMIQGYLATGDSGSHWWRLIERSGQPLGCCLLSEHRGSRQLEVVYIGVIPDARGQGLGKSALQQAIRTARSAGMTSLTAVVDHHNHRARRMYQSLQFVCIEKRVSRIRLLRSLDRENLCEK